MKTLRRAIISALLLMASAAFAAIPQTISYQGYLTEVGGIPVNSSGVSIVFKLYNASSGGTALWTETQSVPVGNGIYQVILGSVTPISLPFDVPYYLGVKVGDNLEMTPRQPLTSVPYALNSAALAAGTQTIQTGSDTSKGLIVKANSATQSASLQEWQNSSGIPLAAMTAAGDFGIAGNLMLPATTATTGIIKAGGQNLLHSYGTQNFFAGLGAGNTTLTQGWNTGVGASALHSLSQGGFNNAIGTAALYNTSSGSGNCAIGYSALYDNTIGGANVAVGNESMGENIGGGYNTAVGNASLSYNTSGSYNTALGTHAGRTFTIENANTTGANNTFIGAYAGPGTTTQLTNATAIGYKALVSQSNSLVLGGLGLEAVKVGIGTKTPSEVLDVVGNIRLNDKDVLFRSGPDTNHGLGWFGGGKLFAGASLDGPALYGFSGGVLGTTSGGQKIALSWNSSGNVGINTATPSERLEVLGTVKATTFSGGGAGLTGLTAGNISGTLAITQGGTGAISSATALANLGAAAVSHSHDATYMTKPVRVAVVAREGGDYRDPLIAINEALDEWCHEPSAANPCLLRIMPGVYSIGTNSLRMQPYVDIEGSGEAMTKIVGSIDSSTAGVVVGASNAELRYLTVENAGAENAVSMAIYNASASPRFSHVTATATAGMQSVAMMNEMSSLTMSDVTLTTSSNNQCQGIYNYNSSAIMNNVRITTGSTCSGYGIYHRRTSGDPSVLITNLHAVISGVNHGYGIYNDGGTVDMRDSLIAAIDNQFEYVEAIHNSNAAPVRVSNSKLEGWIFDPLSGIVYEDVHDSRGKYLTSGSSIVRSGSTTSNALVVQGVYHLTANLQEWQDMEGGITLASISPQGVLSLPTNGLTVGSSQLVLSGGKVGIGTHLPTEVLDVAGNIRLNDKDIFFRSGTDTLHGLGFYGGTKTFASTDVNGPVLYGNGGGALGSISGSMQSIALSWNNANDVSAKGRLTINNIPTGSTSNVLCSSAANSGRIERCSSTRKLKENIVDLPLGLDIVSRMRPVSFTWKANGNEDIGFIAEEMADLNPVLAIYNEQGEPDGVKYANLTAVLAKAMQEQQQAIEQQKEKIETQASMIEELRVELAALRAMMSR
jgi:hypothetical protein